MRVFKICFFILFRCSDIFAASQYNIVEGSSLLGSGKVSVSAKDKKALVIVFLSAKCPCSDSHVKELKKLHAEYPEFAFVAVHSNADETKDLANKYFQQVKIPFPIIEDQNSLLANTYNALKTPHAFVVMPDGKIVYQGGVSSSNNFNKAERKFLREALEDIQHNHSVRTPTGRTLGCVISRNQPQVW